MTDRVLPLVSTEPTPPPFERIAIVGLGLIGGSIALACRQRWPSTLLIAVARNATLELAMRTHAVDVGANDLGVVNGADLVVLATPVGVIARHLGELGPHLASGTVVTDAGSTKRGIVDAARSAGTPLFVGGHPMGGAAVGGFANARPDLFVHRPWIFTPEANTPTEVLERLSTWAAGIGARPVVMDAPEHDRVLAAISHLPQLVASALMATVGERAGDAGLALSGGGLRDTTRLASSPASMWTDVLSTNADEIGPAIDALIEELRRIRTRLDDPSAVQDLFAHAQRWRERLVGRPHEG